MEVLSRSPLPVASLLWQPRPSTWVLTFLCKATFRLEVGESPLSDDQEPIHEEDAYWDDDPARSLYAATDLSPHKPRTDVVLVGSAFSPQPARVIVARLSVGELEKSVEVVQDRALTPDGSIAEGSRWSRMPLVYERAAGGPDTWNPVGVRADTRDSYGRIKLPNLQPAGHQPKVRGEPIPPIGFGPIAPAWPARRAKLGRHASSWSARSLLSAPLPDDLDRSFFNAAPPDQQISGLTEDARIVLENLHPQTQRLVTHLPGLKPRAVLEGRGGMQPLPIRCDALWIDTDRSICTLTWSGQLPLERLDEPGRVVITLDGAVDSESARGSGAAPHALESTTMGSVATHGAGALPFVRSTTAVHDVGERRAPAGSGLPFVPPSSWPAAQPAVPASRSSSPGWPAASVPQPAAPQPIAPQPIAPQPVPVVAQPMAPPPIAPPPVAPPPVAPPPVAPPPVAPPPLAAPAPAPPVAPPPVQPLPIAPPPARSIGEAAVAMAGTSSARVEPISDALSASNAAASPTSLPGAARRPDERPSAPSLTTSSVRASPRLDPREVLHLIWYDPDSVARICRVPAFRSILDELDEEPADPDLDDPSPTRDPAEIEDQRDIFEILARGAAREADHLAEELSAAVKPGGRFVPPLLLIAGDLSFPFDERETLKAAVAVASPMAGPDEALKAAIREAREFLAAADQLCPPTVVEGYTARVRDAFQRSRRGVGPEYLDAQMERALLEGRHYQRRQVLGMVALRALLHPATGSSRQAPVYLPEDIAKKLPLYTRFRARLIAGLYLQEDQYEQHPAALKALALGRIAPAPDRR